MAEDAKPTPLDRVLSLFAEVKAGESGTIILMFFNIFLILLAYYVLKTVRQGLILGSGGMLGLSGAELKSYASAGMAFMLLGIVPAYGILASKVSRIRLLNYCLAGVIVCLGIFFVLGRAGVPLGLAFYLWIGIVNVFLIAQFWSYANDLYTEKQGKRLFAIIAIGSSLGAIVGPEIAREFRAHTYLLMLGCGAVLAICMFLYNVTNQREKRRVEREAKADEDVSEKPLSKDGGFQLVFRQKYLLLIGLMLLVANLVNTTGEYILDTTFETHAINEVPDTAHAELTNPDEREAAIKKDRTAIVNGLSGRFFSIVNLCVFLIQAFLVSRIFKYLGVRTALFILPAIAFGGYIAIGAVGGLLALRIAKTAENSTDYSLQNTIRQALFLPTSREAKYKAKAAIDTFFVRIGDAMSAALVVLGIHVLSFGITEFAFVNVGLVLIWFFIAAGIAKKHKELVPDDHVADA